LLADRVEVFTLVFPESDLSEWIWVVSTLECSFWVLFEDILDLSCPVKERALECLGLVLAG
jgi:hypothetical protein